MADRIPDPDFSGLLDDDFDLSSTLQDHFTAATGQQNESCASTLRSDLASTSIPHDDANIPFAPIFFDARRITPTHHNIMVDDILMNGQYVHNHDAWSLPASSGMDTMCGFRLDDKISG
ncbi:hypothetical protein AA0119_g6304 [Alternaria tenuissima]|uniref:Uncharacterized protein n=1 Tax=Alternaria tenuissima TaxID=119927 RepID=A0A4Q4M7T1_9PLEO|nr:hypothetical protein AA0115_g8460 [Alternaria tenuissima]RYN44960.1 hypothetical protein AA0114_g9427 [Alternaria tenuissima]RYN79286.1 hypothetical protein AA0120_g10768 [Alternaria tenuissima]RYO00170.1 hypothetical protein AA0119_g6304 [Alternaria tenuissima]RYO11762.1 hypothetical protein AA0121_g9701 [Alternaria tenuissima]